MAKPHQLLGPPVKAGTSQNNGGPAPIGPPAPVNQSTRDIVRTSVKSTVEGGGTKLAGRIAGLEKAKSVLSGDHAKLQSKLDRANKKQAAVKSAPVAGATNG